MQAWLILGVAIVAEVAGSTALMKSQQFTRLLPSLATVALYVLAFYCLSLALRHIPLGIAYGVWAGVGIVLTALIGVVLFRQALDLAAIVGIGFIVTGVVLINAVSGSAH
ncbi:DMT family transporter [Paracoccus zeaxanthinifaciens]|uniref:DMT family transporter n=1 Tax=Paracoccus zeaxanthinifaciens TaxID=187400 RepID=UPI0003B6F9CD|nr:multidrug efflux SMR transporter [Paracoccus zeaxanthinifaciens]